MSLVTSTSRPERRGDFFPLIESSGERGDLMMLPRNIGPLGGVSRVGTRKYVFDILVTVANVRKSF